MTSDMEIDAIDSGNDDNFGTLKYHHGMDQENVITHGELNAIFASILEEVREGGGVDDAVYPAGLKLNGISRSLLQLYEIQHSLYDSIQQQESIIEEEISYQNEIQQQSIADEYEQLYLLQQIQHYQQLFNVETLPNLIQFAKGEIGGATTTLATDSTNNTNESSSDEIMAINDDDGNNGDSTAATDTTAAGSSLNSDKEIVKKFLSSHGLDIDSLDDREKILEFIQTCMEERTTVVNQIEVERKEIQVLQQEYKIQNDLLNHSIPTHIQTLERATVTLSKLLYSTSSLSQNKSSSSSNSILGVQHMTGNDRLVRIQMAQQLSSIPLYTIYQSMQHYFDVVQTTQSAGGNTGKDTTNIIGKVSVENHKNEVILHLPVLDVANTAIAATSPVSSNSNNKSNKKVTMVLIHFVHHTTPVPYITVYCTGCVTLLNQELLLDELFPCDVALNDSILHTSVSTTSSMMRNAKNDSHSNAPSSNKSVRGKSYLWCNHLAGLFPVPYLSNATSDTTNDKASTTPFIVAQQQHLSTHVVIHEIQRRIRANATLKYVLHSLCRSRVPTPPLQLPFRSDDFSCSIIYTDPHWKSKCKLTTFSAVAVTAPNSNTTNSMETTTTYNVELRRNANVVAATTNVSSVLFGCTVKISNARYPAIAPIWSFSNRSSSNGSSDETSYYDTHLEQLKYRVNVDIFDIIQRQQPSTHDNDDQREGEQEDTIVLQFCEWILVHQLREIMHFVDSLPDSNDNSPPMDYPIYKGRDRQIR